MAVIIRVETPFALRPKGLTTIMFIIFVHLREKVKEIGYVLLFWRAEHETEYKTMSQANKTRKKVLIPRPGLEYRNLIYVLPAGYQDMDSEKNRPSNCM